MKHTTLRHNFPCFPKVCSIVNEAGIDGNTEAEAITSVQVYRENLSLSNTTVQR